VPSARVLVDSPPFPLEQVRELLADLDVAVEAPPRPWRGEDVVGLLAWQPVGEEDLARMPAVRAVATCSVGYDHIDTAAAARRGIWVCHVPDYCVEEMADTTIAFVLALLRGIVALDRSVRAGRWDDHAAGPLRRAKGTRLGIVGFGRIGRAVAERAAALGLEVWATDPLLSQQEMAERGVRAATLDELLRSCQVVSLHVPLSEATRGLIGARELALMPPGSYLVNTARAQLLDWQAFLRALKTGHLAGAACDVLPVEPPTAECPAPALDTLIVTPHAAWYSPEAEREAYVRATLAVRAVLEGREPEGAVVRP
jgi:D-3-phosphoglycerate dehydrogenase